MLGLQKGVDCTYFHIFPKLFRKVAKILESKNVKTLILLMSISSACNWLAICNVIMALHQSPGPQ